MRHIDRAHLSMMRHLSAQARRKGANSVAEQIGRTGRAPVQRDTALARAQKSFRREQQAAARSMAQPHHTHVKSSIQRGLEAIGLGGAAHPIRRLHHPGGQAVFPFGGRVGARAADASRRFESDLRARMKDPKGSYAHKARLEGKAGLGLLPARGADAHDRLIMSRVGVPVAAAEVVAGGAGVGYGLGYLDSLMGKPGPNAGGRARAKAERESEKSIGPPPGPRGAYLRDVDYLFRTRQITAAQQAQAYAWAWATPPGEIRARRQSLRSGGLKLPPLNKMKP